MLRRADFGKPETTVSKAQLMETVVCSRRTVQVALKFLRDEGVIVPIANFAGGKGNATRYEFRWPRQEEEKAPIQQESRRELIARILAENPRLTYGEAVVLAEG